MKKSGLSDMKQHNREHVDIRGKAEESFDSYLLIQGSFLIAPCNSHIKALP